MTSMKAYSEMTTAERRSAGAKQAAKSRAENRLAIAYGERFGHVYGVQERWFYKAMEALIIQGLSREGERSKSAPPSMTVSRRNFWRRQSRPRQSASIRH
jgi:hypothetical protein